MEDLLKSLLTEKISRKKFIKFCLAGLSSLMFSSIFPKASIAENGRTAKNIVTNHDLVVVKGEDPYAMTVKAIESIGGMGKFVKKGDVVVVKPNIAWDRRIEDGSNTNPKVVSAIVELCFKAGAMRVNVFDRTCNIAERCYENSGIAAAAKEKGANVYFVDDWNFIEAHFPYESPMEGWPIYRDALECDTFINVPVLKHHSLTGLTLSMKNLMGICGGDRGQIHYNIDVKLAHLADFIKPDLTVIDAYRVILRNGPGGGSPDDVEYYNTVITGTNPVLIDSYACELVGRDPQSVGYIREAKKRNFGNSDIGKADILSIQI